MSTINYVCVRRSSCFQGRSSCLLCISGPWKYLYPIPSVGEQLFLLWVTLQSFLNQVAQPTIYIYGSVSKPCTPVVHIKIAGLKWMFIPLNSWYENRYWSIAKWMLVQRRKKSWEFMKHSIFSADFPVDSDDTLHNHMGVSENVVYP